MTVEPEWNWSGWSLGQKILYILLKSALQISFVFLLDVGHHSWLSGTLTKSANIHKTQFFWNLLSSWGEVGEGGGGAMILSLKFLRKCSKHGTDFNQHALINLKPKLGVYEQTLLTLSLDGIITVKNRKEISASRNFTMLPNCGNVTNYGIIISSKLVICF